MSESGTRDTEEVVTRMALSEATIIVYLEGPDHEIVVNSKGLTTLNELGLVLATAMICIDDMPEDLSSELASINPKVTFKTLRDAEEAIASFRNRLIELGVSE